jgi:hypothetical protein
MTYRWRKASSSGPQGDCIELGRLWRKSSHSGPEGNCVELTGRCDCGSQLAAVRDSKHPEGSVLAVSDLSDLVNFAKAGRLRR